tara:strand:+ start:1477 stop:1878 length:402 start_codon:yes stop_codon:yes gene_type:complete
MIIRDAYDIVKLVAKLKEMVEGSESPPILEVIVEKYDPTSTSAQKRLYWKWIDIMCQHTGNHKVTQDSMLRDIFLTPVCYTNNKGQDKSYIKPISTIGKKEMAVYMDQVSIMAAEHGINLPHPEDQHYNRRKR